MILLYSLVLFPLIPAILMFLIKEAAIRKCINIISSLSIIALSLAFSIAFFNRPQEINISGGAIRVGMMFIEAIMSLYIIFMGIKHKKLLAPLFSAVSTGLLLWFELTLTPETNSTLLIDRLSILMVLIIGVIGGLICAFSGDYMRSYHKHHEEYKDRSHVFFMTLYVFIFAMFGLVLSNDMLWMFFFWEITTLCSFLLIGYTRTEEATKNSFTALTINAGGGLCFAVGIVILWMKCGVIDIKDLLHLNSSIWMLAGVYLLGIAGLTKSAQLPFSKWLLGAMVAPTPTSAMLHSSTMVKAGVYLLIRIAPLLNANHVGITFVIVGGLTFLITALLAISQQDAKRVLAYSTLSNLGLIVACAGIGTAESIWAAIMLLIFHAIAKSLMFLTVGVTENILGSRDLEDMDGLFNVSGTLTMLFVIGIAGMFLAPFGMLISKWAAMKAFIDSGNMLIVVLVAFGSSATLFFWTKWMGKLLGSFSGAIKSEAHEISIGQKLPLFALAIMVVAVCLSYPLISTYIIIPYLENTAYVAPISPLSRLNNTLVITMMGVLFMLPLLLIPIYRRNRIQRTSVYLSGLNTGDNQSFYGSMGKIHLVEHKNWYLQKFFGEHVLLRDSTALLWVVLLAGFVVSAVSILTM